MKVKVLAKDGQELMPTTIEKANKLIAKGEAEIVENSPLVIRMLKATKRYKQDTFEKEVEYENNPYLIPLGKKYSEENGLEPLYWDIKNYNNYLFCSYQDEVLNNFNNIIVNHVSNNDNFQMIIADPMLINSMEYAGVKNISIIRNIYELNETIQSIYDTMMNRVKLMEQAQTRSLDKLDILVSKIFINGRAYNWDDYILINRPKYSYSDEKVNMFAISRINIDNLVVAITAQEIYDLIITDRIEYLEMVNYYRNESRYITKENIRLSEQKEKYIPRNIVLHINDLNMYMSSSEYRPIDNIKQNLSHLLRLGKAMGIGIMIVGRPFGGSTLTNDNMNWISNKCLVGKINATTSTLFFEKILDSKQNKNEGYVDIFGRLCEIRINDAEKEFNFDTDSILTQTNKFYLRDHRENLEGFINEEPPTIKVDLIKEENKKDEYVYLSKGEVKERLLKKINSLEEEIDSIKEDIDILFSELDNIIE